MKRVLISVIISAMLLSMSACQSQNSVSTTSATSSSTSATSSSTSATSSSTSATSSSTSAATSTSTAKKIDISTIKSIFKENDYPRIDGSTVTIPLSELVYSVANGVSQEEARLNVLHNKTHSAYENLIKGDADVIFVTYPSVEEMQLAKDAGVELEIVPIVKDAFIFLLNKENPVDVLTVEDIQMIYGGFYLDWSRFGGENAVILPYQRPVNSGSQTGMLNLVMGNKPISDAPTQMRPGGMGELIEAIASYDNSKNAIGYSYYYYAEAMYNRDTTKYVAVNGVSPNPDTIISGEYPFCTAYYAVFNKKQSADSNVRKLVDFILSDDGQAVAKEAGYVPIR